MALPAPKFTSPWDEVYDFLTNSPTPDEILAFMVSETLDDRMQYLMDQSNRGRITDGERAEFEELLRLDDFISTLKIKARQKLAGAT